MKRSWREPLRFGVIGAGFWASYQLAAWKELPEARCAAICNRTASKAEKLAQTFGIPAVYGTAEAMLSKERLDFVDIITDVDTHCEFVRLALRHKLPAICQKPLAPSLREARGIADAARKAGVPLLVHENWRWQQPMQALRKELQRGGIGQPFRARIDMISGFPVFKNQPFLAELEQFILTDLGSHILDAARALFGEADSLSCHTARVHPNIRGEDVATVLLRMRAGCTVLCNLAYAENYLEHDRFPETYVFIEGAKGSIELGPDFWIRTTTRKGTVSRRHPPKRFDWADPAYDVVHSSIVDCHRNLLQSLLGGEPAETTAEDNLRTVQLVFAAYDSAKRNAIVKLGAR